MRSLLTGRFAGKPKTELAPMLCRTLRDVTNSSVVAVQIFDQKKWKRSKDQGFLGVVNIQVGQLFDVNTARNVESGLPFEAHASCQRVGSNLEPIFRPSGIDRKPHLGAAKIEFDGHDHWENHAGRRLGRQRKRDRLSLGNRTVLDPPRAHRNSWAYSFSVSLVSIHYVPARSVVIATGRHWDCWTTCSCCWTRLVAFRRPVWTSCAGLGTPRGQSWTYLLCGPQHQDDYMAPANVSLWFLLVPW